VSGFNFQNVTSCNLKSALPCAGSESPASDASPGNLVSTLADTSVGQRFVPIDDEALWQFDQPRMQGVDPAGIYSQQFKVTTGPQVAEVLESGQRVIQSGDRIMLPVSTIDFVFSDYVDVALAHFQLMRYGIDVSTHFELSLCKKRKTQILPGDEFQMVLSLVSVNLLLGDGFSQTAQDFLAVSNCPNSLGEIFADNS
jgi:hypothetical protein